MRRPISLQGCGFTSSQNRPNLDSEEIYDAETDSFTTVGVSLCNPKVCAAVLANYSRLKEDSWGVFDSDTFYFMEDFDRIADTALTSRPLYERIIELKVDGLQNNEIQETNMPCSLLWLCKALAGINQPDDTLGKKHQTCCMSTFI